MDWKKLDICHLEDTFLFDLFDTKNIICFFEFKRFLADIISVLGMTISEGRECLKFRMLGSKEELESWGHEYVR